MRCQCNLLTRSARTWEQTRVWRKGAERERGGRERERERERGEGGREKEREREGGGEGRGDVNQHAH